MAKHTKGLAAVGIDPVGVGIRIRRARLDAGMSNRDLLNAMGKNRKGPKPGNTLTAIQRGDQGPDIATLVLLSRALDVTTDWILFGPREKALTTL